LAREKSTANRAISRSPPRPPSGVSKSPARPSSDSRRAEEDFEDEPHEDEQMAFTPNACINLWIKGTSFLISTICICTFFKIIILKNQSFDVCLL
jgi:hypothetical protein